VEPFAGEGDIARAVNAHRRRAGLDLVDWKLYERRGECLGALRRPFLTHGTWIDDTFRVWRNRLGFSAECSVIITNPPFSRAAEFLELAIDVAPQAWLCMLLRQGWQASAKRADLLRQFAPDAYHLPDRPPFGRTNGRNQGTDRADYNWLVWPPEPRRRRRWGRNGVLDTTPQAVRERLANERAHWASLVGAPSALAA